jgi:biotin carboxyl carrier protein
MEKKLDKLTIDDTEYSTEIPEYSRKPYEGVPDPSEVRAFIPGTIVDVKVSEGDSVQPGDVLLLLDAMKMHNEICSTIQGRVKQLHVKMDDTVQKNQLMVSISSD